MYTAKFSGEGRPAVSILIPVHNAAPRLRHCLDSALGQTLRDIEVVCVDDGSTDSSPAILAEHAARDPRLRVISQTNHGAFHARSEAARAARGEYFLCLDADDTFRPGIVERAVAVARERGVDVVEFAATIRHHGFLRWRRCWKWGSPKRQWMNLILRQPDLARAATLGLINSVLWNKLVHRKIFLAADGDIPEEVRMMGISHRSDELFYIPLLCRARTYTAIPDIGYDYTVWSFSQTHQEETIFAEHLSVADELSLCLRTLHRILPPSLHPHLFDRYLCLVHNHIEKWDNFTLSQRLQAWRRLMDAFRFSGAAIVHCDRHFFGRRRTMEKLCRNLHRRRPLRVLLGEWGRRLLRRP
jgi:glycosyltransferase involved in cell wall biosynthesis